MTDSEPTAAFPIRILYEEGPCVVVWKPPGLATQAPAQFDSLERRMRDWVRRKRGTTGNVYLGVPHRLDRPVSGAIVFALHVRAAHKLSKQFEARQVRKTYRAWVAGTPTAPEGDWIDHLRKVPDEPRSEIVPPHHPDAVEARMSYRVAGEAPGATLLEIQLGTGRMHQIRLQCAARGLPVLGDALYGSTYAWQPPVADARERPIALHAVELGFAHPMTREPVVIVAPPPDWWDRTAEVFRVPAAE